MAKLIQDFTKIDWPKFPGPYLVPRFVFNMSKVIVSVKKFNTDNITFSAPRQLDSGGKSIYMNYSYDANTRKNITVQIGSLALPFGLNVYDKNGPENIKYSMNLSLRGYDDNEKVKAIYEMFNTLDEFMIDQGVANSKLWFKGQKSREAVQDFYTPIVQWAKDADGNKKTYPPTLKVQLRQKKEAAAFDLELYDENGNEINDTPLKEVLVKGAQVTCLIQCTGVWFAGSKYGLSWKAVQIRVDKIPESIRGYSIRDEDDGEETNTRTTVRSTPMKAAPAPAPAPANKFATLASNDDDEEEQEEDEDFREAAPATSKPSVVAAVMPSPAPAPTPAPANDDADDVEPVAVPVRKSVVTKKAVVKTTTGKKA